MASKFSWYEVEVDAIIKLKVECCLATFNKQNNRDDEVDVQCVWFQDSSATHILREIKFGEDRRSKIAVYFNFEGFEFCWFVKF